MTRRPLALLLTLAATMLLGGACTQPHLSANFGRSHRSWFVAQHVNQKYQDPAAARPFIEGLDAAEASVVTKNYRTITSKGEGGSGQSRILMVAPPRTGSESYMPPPSVPGGQ